MRKLILLLSVWSILLVSSAWAQDEKAKVSSGDSTPDFLMNKFQAGTDIELTESGTTNRVIIIGRKPVLTTKGDVLTHDGSKESRLGVGDSGQYLTSDSSDNLIWANPPEGDQLFNSNVLLNAFRTAENGSRPILKMVDGGVDAFEDESGIDVTSSSNEIYNSGGNFYGNTGTGTLISQSTGTAIGNLTYRGGLSAAFDGTTIQAHTASAGRGPVVITGTIGKDWGSGVTKKISGIKIWGANASVVGMVWDTTNGNGIAIGEVSVKLYGSTDNFSSSNVFLGDVALGFLDNSSNINKVNLNGFDTLTAYRYHRVEITNSKGNFEPTVAELEFYEPGTPSNMTLIPNSQTAKSQSDGAHLILFAEDPAADITLNTDVKAYVSRDDGTTFSQVTLSDAGEFEKGNLLTGTVDISSQPSGTDMQWKVETFNSKALNLHGVGLEWR
ncbi:MAG: hypothetical protein HOK41_13090 [Nitrospina sp.]|jgi:hypothetical protein|nr:hypothetical protein [Nitrospina sp.]MBT6716473.1 hypothetical protein [Nitrospina sp.]